MLVHFYCLLRCYVIVTWKRHKATVNVVHFVKELISLLPLFAFLRSHHVELNIWSAFKICIETCSTWDTYYKCSFHQNNFQWIVCTAHFFNANCSAVNIFSYNSSEFQAFNVRNKWKAKNFSCEIKWSLTMKCLTLVNNCLRRNSPI